MDILRPSQKMETLALSVPFMLKYLLRVDATQYGIEGSPYCKNQFNLTFYEHLFKMMIVSY